jgi:transcriptional regulator with XRE-family HTH domain
MRNDNFLNQIRKRQKLKLKDISSKTGLSVGYLGTIFSGRLSFVPEQTKSKIAMALGVSKKFIY